MCALVILDIVGVMWRQRWWEQRSKISTYWQYSPPASPALRCITRPASSSTQPRPPKNVPTRPKKSRLHHYWIFVSHNSQSPNGQSDESSEQVIRDLVENFAAPVSAAPFLSINQRISEKRRGITIKIIITTNKAIDYTIDFNIFSKQQLCRYNVTYRFKP